MRIETSRMYIRDFDPGDLNDLHEIFGDAEPMKNCEPAYTPEKTRQFLNEFCIGKNGALAAVLKQTNKVIGYILFKPWEGDVYEIGGYLIRIIGSVVMRMSPVRQSSNMAFLI